MKENGYTKNDKTKIEKTIWKLGVSTKRLKPIMAQINKKTGLIQIKNSINLRGWAAEPTMGKIQRD